MRARRVAPSVLLVALLGVSLARADVAVVEAVMTEAGPFVRTVRGEVHAVTRPGRTAWLVGRVPRRCSRLAPEGEGAWCVVPPRSTGRSALLVRVQAERPRVRSWPLGPVEGSEGLGPPIAARDGTLLLAGGWGVDLEARVLHRAPAPSPHGAGAAGVDAPFPGLEPVGAQGERTWWIRARGPRPLVAHLPATGVVEEYRVRGRTARRWRSLGSAARAGLVHGPLLIAAGAACVAASPVLVPAAIADSLSGPTGPAVRRSDVADGVTEDAPDAP
jgi:hypothetical protein